MKERIYKDNEKLNYNTRHRAKNLPKLQTNDRVWVKDQIKF